MIFTVLSTEQCTQELRNEFLVPEQELSSIPDIQSATRIKLPLAISPNKSSKDNNVLPTWSYPVFLPGESQGRGSLVGCRLWGRTESDTTEVTQQQQQLQLHILLETAPQLSAVSAKLTCHPWSPL